MGNGLHKQQIRGYLVTYDFTAMESSSVGHSMVLVASVQTHLFFKLRGEGVGCTSGAWAFFYESAIGWGALSELW